MRPEGAVASPARRRPAGSLVVRRVARPAAGLVLRLVVPLVHVTLVVAAAVLRPELLWFWLPAAYGGSLLHLWKGWPWAGLGYALLVGVVGPLLLAPHLLAPGPGLPGQG